MQLQATDIFKGLASTQEPEEPSPCYTICAGKIKYAATLRPVSLLSVENPEAILKTMDVKTRPPMILTGAIRSLLRSVQSKRPGAYQSRPCSFQQRQDAVLHSCNRWRTLAPRWLPPKLVVQVIKPLHYYIGGAFIGWVCVLPHPPQQHSD